MSTSVKVSKGAMFRCTVAVDDSLLEKMKKAPELAAKAMQVGADYWHTKILLRHFESYAHGRYGYANRALSTKQDKRKAGKPDLVCSGSLRDSMKSRASFQISGGNNPVVTIKMTARVLNFVPNMSETSDDSYVKQKGGKSYPNLKREIRVIRDDERKDISLVIKNELVRLFGV